MDDSLNHQKMAEETGIDPEKVDFILDEKELEDISGGIPANCGEIGLAMGQCTGTGA